MSIIEDFEQDTSVTYGLNMREDSLNKDLGPIFKKIKFDYLPENAISSFLVSNNILLIYTEDRKLNRIDANTRDIYIHDFNKYLSVKTDNVKLYQIFHSPNGLHSILSFSYYGSINTSENFYFCKKKHTIIKPKGYLISAVGWNHQYEQKNLDDSTSNIFIGTNKGLIFEVELSMKGENKLFFNNVLSEHYMKQVFDFKSNAGESNSLQITAIEFYTLKINKNEKVTFLFVTLPKNIYQFISKYNENEGFTLINLFNNFEKREIPGNLGYSKLDVFYDLNKTPKKIAWLIEPGVFYAHINVNKKNKDNLILELDNIIPYQSSNVKDKPISVLITEYHILVLFKDLLKVICNVNNKVVMEDKFLASYGDAIGITKDLYKNMIWAYTELAIYYYNVVEEDRYILNICLEKKDFKNAEICAKNNPQKLNLVYCKEAQYYFENKDYLKSAELFAKSNQPFEEVALNFFNLENKSILKKYLIYKLDTFNENDIIKINLLVIWLVKILLKELDDIKQNKIFDEQRYKLVQDEFENLLSNKLIINAVKDTKKAIYDLFSNQADDKYLIFFAKVTNDYEYLIKYFLQIKEYNEILKIIKDSKKNDLIYKFSSILIQNLPIKYIDVLINNYTSLDLNILLPTLIMKKNDKEFNDLLMKQLIRYLEHCVYTLNVREEIVYNYLITFYCEICPEKIVEIISYVKKKEIVYDLKYTLRLCNKKGLFHACVDLYILMKMYEDAFDYALLFDVNLAKKIANMDVLNKKLKKKLWIKLTKHVISKNNDINHLSELINEFENITIEDVLPFFPDISTIDLFKEPICESLNKYINKIQVLRTDLKEIEESTELLRNDIKLLTNGYKLIKSEQNCFICNLNILTREFYFFPCQHFFHTACLEEKLILQLNEKESNNLKKLKEELVKINKMILSSQSSDASIDDLLNRKKTLLNQYETILCSDCFLCGELTIQLIDKPFTETIFDEEGWN